jgi:hypothetical protein
MVGLGASAVGWAAGSVSIGVLDGAGVAEGTLVAVDGELVATTMTTRAVGVANGTGVGLVAMQPVAAATSPKNKSERMTFAFKAIFLFIVTKLTNQSWNHIGAPPAATTRPA